MVRERRWSWGQARPRVAESRSRTGCDCSTEDVEAVFIYTHAGELTLIETLRNYVRPAVRDQHGQTFVEYTLLLVGISLLLLLAFQPLGVSLQGFLNAITDLI